MLSKLLMHIDVIIQDLLHIFCQKLGPCKLPQGTLLLALQNQMAFLNALSASLEIWLSTIHTCNTCNFLTLFLVDSKNTSQHCGVCFGDNAAIVRDLQPQHVSNRFRKTQTEPWCILCPILAASARAMQLLSAIDGLQMASAGLFHRCFNVLMSGCQLRFLNLPDWFLPQCSTAKSNHHSLNFVLRNEATHNAKSILLIFWEPKLTREDRKIQDWNLYWM